jgi:hypothetical protein
MTPTTAVAAHLSTGSAAGIFATLATAGALPNWAIGAGIVLLIIVEKVLPSIQAVVTGWRERREASQQVE